MLLENLRSLSGHATLVLMKTIRSLSGAGTKDNTCLNSSEGKTLDPNGQGLRFNIHSGILFLAILFSLDAKIAILTYFVCL